MNRDGLYISALQQENGFQALYDAIVELRKQNIDKSLLLEELEALRYKVPSEVEEDIIMDVMDCLVGWCSPLWKIV